MVGWLEFNVPFQHKYGYIRRVPSWEGTFAQSENTIEPSVCCGDVALYQITFTMFGLLKHKKPFGD